MNRKVLLIFFLFFCALLYSQEDKVGVCLNNEGLTLDSLELIVNNAEISYKEKMEALYKCNYKRNSQQEKHVQVINRLLSESKKKKDINGLLYHYVYLADLHHEWNDKVLFNLYVDSADIYAEDATHSFALARYCYTKGTQAIYAPYGKKEGYRQFEKAIDYYDPTSQEIQIISYDIYNISVYTANQPDTIFADRLIRKVENLLQKKYSPFVDFSLSAMKSDLYYTYYDARQQEAMLDSAIFYEKKRIELFDSHQHTLPRELEYDLLQSCLLIAEYCSLKQHPDRDPINEYIERAKSIGYTEDTYIMSRIKYTEAISLFEQKKYDEAENHIIEAENHLLQQINEGDAMYPPETFYADESVYAGLHGKILYAKGDYKGALRYNRTKNHLKLKMRNIETRELEFLYNTEKEEHKIEQLKIKNANQVKSTGMLILVTLLLVAAILLICLWFYTAKKSIQRRSALIKAEKEEAELNLRIKEEQAVKAQLEKYEVLSDYRLKEMELEGKNKAMEQLMKDKEILDQQIEAYAQKINEYEHINDKKPDSVKTAEALNKLVIEDIARLIAKKVPDKKNAIESLGCIDEHYISVLKNSYNGNLSIPYIKYCVCFAIGLEIGEVSECFSIEQASVHMVRYRLKKKFGLDINDDLDIFLRKMHNTISSAKVTNEFEPGSK
jgi:Tfp pilus assembly protein PilN